MVAGHLSFDYEEDESETSETKACVTTAGEAPITIPSASGPIFQAFSLLKESPAAQVLT